MPGMLPRAPLFSRALLQGPPACELVLPPAAPRHADVNRLARWLPPGVPDRLEVSIIRAGNGSERCTAAWYGERAYLIHLAILPAGS